MDRHLEAETRRACHEELANFQMAGGQAPEYVFFNTDGLRKRLHFTGEKTSDERFQYIIIRGSIDDCNDDRDTRLRNRTFGAE